MRELVSFGGKKEAEKPERSEGQKLLDAQSNRNMAAASAINPHDEWVYGKPLQALNISILRDYLFNEFKCLQTALPFGFDFERIIDDFVFMCFFVGKYFHVFTINFITLISCHLFFLCHYCSNIIYLLIIAFFIFNLLFL